MMWNAQTVGPLTFWLPLSVENMDSKWPTEVSHSLVVIRIKLVKPNDALIAPTCHIQIILKDGNIIQVLHLQHTTTPQLSRTAMTKQLM
jgi:hypothetical protein